MGGWWAVNDHNAMVGGWFPVERARSVGGGRSRGVVGWVGHPPPTTFLQPYNRQTVSQEYVKLVFVKQVSLTERQRVVGVVNECTIERY